jgi:translation initiation factor IF-3
MNELIRAAEIRVIADDGEQLGVMTPADAIERAQSVGLDLVEVAPGSKPPVCRIMDYGRYKYERKKKMGKSKGHAASLKEVKLRPRTDQHDLDFKLKNARRFLTDGDKVKVTVMYRGREMVHREFGYKQLDQVRDLLADIANVENPPRMEGRFLSMILVPMREAIEALQRAEAAEKTGGKKPNAASEPKVEEPEPVAKAGSDQSEEPSEGGETADVDKAADKAAENADNAENVDKVEKTERVVEAAAAEAE